MNYKVLVGKRLAKFNNPAYTEFTTGQYAGQCVTYVRGRAKEKINKVFAGGFACAKQMIQVAKNRGLPTGKKPATDSFLVFGNGQYGHVQYCEYVTGNTVYYTEANWNGDNRVSNDDGVLKTTTISKLENNPDYLGCIYLSKKPATPHIKKGNHKLLVDLFVRAGAGTNYAILKYTQLTADGKLHAYLQSKACLKAGTVVTVSETKTVKGNIWCKIPSGWICGYYINQYYIK